MCRRSCDYVTCDFFPCFFARFNYFYYLCSTKNNNNPKHNNPIKSKIMIIKHLQGGGYRASFSRRMQCVAVRHWSLIAIVLLTTALASCATQRKSELRVYDKV